MTSDFMFLVFGIAAILSTAAMHYKPSAPRRRNR